MNKIPSHKESKFHTLVFIVGPTAVGKTNLSLFLAERLPAAILNCDSVQMFRGLNIGSAKPVFKKYSDNISFFLYDQWDPPFVCSAGDFRKKALSVLNKELAERPVLAVGGSGFYIQALEKGMYPVKKMNPEIKSMVNTIRKEKGVDHLYSLLKVLDPEYARVVSSRDAYRISRGLCLLLSEKKSISQIRLSFKLQNLPYPVYKIGLYLPKRELLKRVQDRTKQMLQEGLLDEVKRLLDMGFEDWPLMNSVGYKECVLFLKGKFFSKDDLEKRIVQRTMQLAKKQMVWFKRDKNIRWYISEGQWQTIYKDLKKHCQ